MADEKNVIGAVVVKTTDAATKTVTDVKAAADSVEAVVKTKDVKKPKAAKKVTKKVTKKAAKKVTKKVAKKTTKKAVKKTAKKASSAKKDGKSESNKVERRIAQLQELLQANLNGLSGDKAEAMAKNIWLAGLGAYSKTFEELTDRYDDIQDKYDEINEEGQKVFGDLVDRGQSMQNELELKVSKGRETLEDRVDGIKKRLGGGLSSFVDIPERLSDAAEKIERFSEKLRNKKEK